MSVNRVLDPAAFTSFRSAGNFTSRRTLAEGVYELFRFLLPATIGLMFMPHLLFGSSSRLATCLPRIFFDFTHCFICSCPFLSTLWHAPAGMELGSWRMALVFAPLSPWRFGMAAAAGAPWCPWSLLGRTAVHSSLLPDVSTATFRRFFFQSLCLLKRCCFKPSWLFAAGPFFIALTTAIF